MSKPMDITDVIGLVRAAAGDPQRLALATLDLVLSAHGPELRPVIEAAAVPHWFTASVLARLLNINDMAAEEFVVRLGRLPVVEPFTARAGWNVHEATRLALRRELAERQPERFLELSKQAAECFPGEDTHLRVETLYHRALGYPDRAASELADVHERWANEGKMESLQALAHPIRELRKHARLSTAVRARSAIYLAAIAEGYLTLRETERLAREALALLQDAPDDIAEIDARDALGDALKGQGKFPAALAEFRHWNGIVEKLAELHPENPKWQRDLSVSHNKLGSIYQAQNRLDDALAEYRIYQSILSKLTAGYPENSTWQRELFVGHSYLGDVYQLKGQLDEALREHESHKTGMLGLLLRFPDNMRWQVDLAVAHQNVGFIKQQLGKLEEALLEYQSYRAIMQRVAREDPENYKWQVDLAVSHQNTGYIKHQLGQLSEAMEDYQAFGNIMERVSQQDTGNIGWQQQWANSNWWIASLHEASGEKKEAIQRYRRTCELIQKMLDVDPGNEQWKADLTSATQTLLRLENELPAE